MYIAAGAHPDQTTLANFRKQHLATFQAAKHDFLHVLVAAGVVDLKTLAIDGTKLKVYAARERR